MNERHVRAGAEQLQRPFGRRVAAADDHDAPSIVRMRLAVIVMDVRQILARHVQQVRRVVVADREDDVARVTDAADAARRARFDGKDGRRLSGRFAAWMQLALDGEHRLLERDLQIERLDDLAVVLQRLGARRLVVRRHERQPADLEQLGRREEHHLRRKIEDGIDEHALLDHLVVEPTLLGGDGGGQPRRSGADDEEITNGHTADHRGGRGGGGGVGGGGQPPLTPRPPPPKRAGPPPGGAPAPPLPSLSKKEKAHKKKNPPQHLMGRAPAPPVRFCSPPLPAPPRARRPRGGFPALVSGLKPRRAAWAARAPRTRSGKQVIFAWFENKKAALAWYYSDMHRSVAKGFFPNATERTPMADIPDDGQPIMAIASLTPAPAGSDTKMPFSQIAIELYRPLPGGLALGGHFAPAPVPEVPDCATCRPARVVAVSRLHSRPHAAPK